MSAPCAAGRTPERLASRPAELEAIPTERHVPLDVREAIRRGEEPFKTIMAAVAGLAPDQALVLRAPFEPIPLYGVLAKRGLAHWTQRRADDDWLVWFYRGEATPTPAPAVAAAGGDTLDVRGLDPPQPMVAVLARLETLAPGQTLTVIHDRRPTFLYPQLDERGFTHATDEPEPGTVRIAIRRAAP
jgi:uncharacterized protein (DUF2249 family)